MPSVISNSYLQPCEIHCLVTFLLTVSCRVQTSCTRQPHFLTHQTLVSRRQALTLLVVCSILAFCKLFKPGPAGIGCVQKLLILWSEWSITEEDSGMVYGPQPEAAHIIQGGLANVATNAMVSKQMQMARVSEQIQMQWSRSMQANTVSAPNKARQTSPLFIWNVGWCKCKCIIERMHSLQRHTWAAS